MASNAEFVDRLRAATTKYLESIDAWEAAYRKYYRVLAPGVSSDLEPEHQAYTSARRDLERLLPEARRLCLKYSQRDPWPALMHVRLGARTPQDGFVTAIGRAERAALAQCLDHLESACHGLDPAPPRDALPASNKNLIQRVFDFFF